MVLKIFRRLAGDERGNILLLMGLSVAVLFAAGGIGFDLGIQQIVRAKLQQAADAAATAAAMQPVDLDPAADRTNREQTALRYFNLNFPATFLGVSRPSGSHLQINVLSTTVEIVTDADVPMRFLGNIGFTSKLASARSLVEIAAGPPPSFDIILVMDLSKSMDNADVGAFGPTYQAPDAGAPCNVFIQYPSTPVPDGDCPPPAGPTRLNALRGSTIALANSMLNPNTYNSQIGAVTWSDLVVNSLPLTGNYATVRNFLGQMVAHQGTNSTTGLQAAQTMSSGFRSGTVHAVILFTDGLNYANAFGQINHPAGPIYDPVINPQSLAVCNALKADDVVVYTVGFGSQVAASGPAQDFLSNCASGPAGSNLGKYFFLPTTATDLNSAFSSILRSVRKIRVKD